MRAMIRRHLLEPRYLLRLVDMLRSERASRDARRLLRIIVLAAQSKLAAPKLTLKRSQ